MELLLYCTKAKPYLTRNDLPNEKGEFYKHWQLGGELDKKHLYGDTPILNGKIVAECDYEVEEIIHPDNCISYYCKSTLLKEKSCLTDGQIYSYLKDKNGYAIHIKNLHIFDNPRELDDCEKYPKPIFDFTNNYYDDNYYELSHITKAPQNMCKVKLDNKPYILISIRPEWMCKILNGEKTIEVRKKVLKEMISNE